MTAVLLAATLALSAPELEKAFWDCDVQATQTMLNSSEAAICSSVFEKFKAERFKSFPEFLAYWKANKEREHKARTK